VNAGRAISGSNSQRYRNAVALAVLLLAQTFARADTPNPSQKIDRIVIVKSAREMTLIRDGKPVKIYKVALGTNPLGAKQREGDHKTPEGIYAVDSKIAQSRFHRPLHISYPNAADRERARTMGVSPGGDVEIHGLGAKYGWVGAAHREYDWTDGCVAVTNREIDEIWPIVLVGTPVEIWP
jgi:murein L,D-transpeptidase YafK